jgi:hypothetical protein
MRVMMGMVGKGGEGMMLMLLTLTTTCGLKAGGCSPTLLVWRLEAEAACGAASPLA